MLYILRFKNDSCNTIFKNIFYMQNIFNQKIPFSNSKLIIKEILIITI